MSDNKLSIYTATILILAIISQIVSYMAVDRILARTLSQAEPRVYITVSGNTTERTEEVTVGEAPEVRSKAVLEAKQEETPAAAASVGTTTGLTRQAGVNWYGSQKETYYNMPMDGVLNAAKQRGIEGEYFVREDGCKMYRTADGEYIICAANWLVHPYGSTCSSSLGECIVLDTGGFAEFCPEQIDIATTW